MTGQQLDGTTYPIDILDWSFMPFLSSRRYNPDDSGYWSLGRSASDLPIVPSGQAAVSVGFMVKF
jgi:hypothetical protein